MNRRDLLRLTAASGLATLLPDMLLASNGARRPLRVAHLTDVHVLKLESAQRGFAAALRRVYATKPRPDLILVGGDCVMETVHVTDAGARAQWDEWHAILKDYDRIPIHPVLGNHDYHWSKEPTGDPLAQRVEGAKWAMNELRMTERYHSFDAGGWRFLMLDSVAWENRNYHAELDEPQVEWLKAELARTPKTMPILVTSHVSIFGACGFNEPKALKDGPQNGHWEIPTSWMHADALAIKELFKSHGNVRLCLSGHMHQLDDVTLAGTRYLCAGAVCGNWWTANRYFDTDRGFVVADLHPDGRVETQYVSYDGAPSLRL